MELKIGGTYSGVEAGLSDIVPICDPHASGGRYGGQVKPGEVGKEGRISIQAGLCVLEGNS